MKRALMLFGALALTACGADGPSGAGDVTPAGTIDVSMTDMAFTPKSLTVKSGQTVTFRFRNDGAVKHEALIGTLAEQDEHHAEMAAGDGGHDMSGDTAGDMDHEMTGDMTGDMDHEMSGDMADMHAITVEPGGTAELTHTFDTPGELLIGCHEKGHWEDGMKMTIDVTA